MKISQNCQSFQNWHLSKDGLIAIKTSCRYSMSHLAWQMYSFRWSFPSRRTNWGPHCRTCIERPWSITVKSSFRGQIAWRERIWHWKCVATENSRWFTGFSKRWGFKCLRSCGLTQRSLARMAHGWICTPLVTQKNGFCNFYLGSGHKWTQPAWHCYENNSLSE